MGRRHSYTRLVLCLIGCFLSTVSAEGEGSCVGRCGEGYFRGDACHCDYNCMVFMECCPDYKALCTTESSCKGRCHDGFERGQECDCDSNCVNYGKCCSDYETTCAKPIQRRSPPPPPPVASLLSTHEGEKPLKPTVKPKDDTEQKDLEALEQKDEAPKKKSPKTNSRTPRNKKDDRLSDPEEQPEDTPRKKKLQKIIRRIPRRKIYNEVPDIREDPDDPDDDTVLPSRKKKPQQKKNKRRPGKLIPKKTKKKKFIVEYEDDPEDADEKTRKSPKKPSTLMKNKKNPGKKDKIKNEKKKTKTLVESEEEIEESEENTSSTSFSSSSSKKGSKTSKKLLRKNKKNPLGDDDNPIPDNKDLKKNHPPHTDDKNGKPKKRKTTITEEEDGEDPNGKPREPKKRRPPGDKEDGKPKKPRTNKDGEDPGREPKKRRPPGDEEDGKPKKPRTNKDGDDPGRDPKMNHPSLIDDKDGEKNKRKTTTITEEDKDKESLNRKLEVTKKRRTSLTDDKDVNPKRRKTTRITEEEEENPNGPKKEILTPSTLAPISPAAERTKKPKEPIDTENTSKESPDKSLSTTSSDTLKSKTTKKRSPTKPSKEKKVIYPDELSKPDKGKKPQKKPTSKEVTKKKKKLVDSEAEREETRLSEFSSSSQSSSSHRRSKTSSRRLSGKNKKNIKEKNKKKFPPEPEPSTTPKPRKYKFFTPLPTTDGSGDEGSGMDFWTTTPVTHITTVDLQGTIRTNLPDGHVSSTTMYKTENSSGTTNITTATIAEQGTTPKNVSNEEASLRTPITVNIFTQRSTAFEGKFKESSLATDNPLQLKSRTSPSMVTEDKNTRNILSATVAAAMSKEQSSPIKDISSTDQSLGASTVVARLAVSSMTNLQEQSTADNTINNNSHTTKVQYSTSKAPEKPDVSLALDEATKSTQQPHTAQAIVADSSTNPMEYNGNRISTEDPSKSKSLTTEQKIERSRTSPMTAIPLQTLSPIGSQKDTFSKETVTLMVVSEPTKSISPSLHSKYDISLKTSTILPEIYLEGTTMHDKASLTTEETNIKNTLEPEKDSEEMSRPTKNTFFGATATPKLNLNVTPRYKPRKEYTSTQRHQSIQSLKTTTRTHSTKILNIKETTNKPEHSITTQLVDIEEIVNKNKTISTLPLDPDHICNILREKGIKLGIPEEELQEITDICMEMQHRLTPVSTPSSETSIDNPEQKKYPPSFPANGESPPYDNQHSGSRLIQIIQEINKRINIPPVTDLTRIPSQNTNKSTAWMLLYNKIRYSDEPLAPQMNICKGPPADGMTTLQNGSLVVFRGHYFWMINQGGAEKPRKISEVYGIPSPIDTVFTRCSCGGKTFFFKGPLYWRFTNHVMDPGYPKEIAKGFGGLRGKITAVLSVSGFRRRPESVYFFKSGGTVQKYTYRQQQSQPKKCTKDNRPSVRYPIYGNNIQTVKYRFPRNIVRHRIKIQRTFVNKPVINHQPLGVLHEENTISSTWRGIPNNIVSAVSLPNPQKQDGYDYFVFSKEKYYNINMSSMVVVKPPPQAKLKTTKDWYNCNE